MGFGILRFSFTYQYQNFLSRNNKIILDTFKIDDVTKQDSVYILSVEKGYSSKLFIDLTCNETQIQELLADIPKNIRRHISFDDKFIIATISSIHKVKYKIDSDVEDDGQEQNVYLNINAPDAFLCKGKLIDVYTNSKK